MSELTRFTPLRSLSRLDPFSRDLDDLFKGFFMTPVQMNRLNEAHIPIDLTENDESYKLRAEIPGFKKEDIHVSVHGDQVSISAETRQEREEKKGEQVVLRECSYGRQYRAFTLPQQVDDNRVNAKYTDGVLELILPKKAPSSAKRIQIG